MERYSSPESQKKTRQSREERLKAALRAALLQKRQRMNDETTTEHFDSTDFKESDYDYQLLSDSECSCIPILYSMISGHLHPALTRFFQGNYDVLLKTASRFIIIGDFQFLRTLDHSLHRVRFYLS